MKTQYFEAQSGGTGYGGTRTFAKVSGCWDTKEEAFAALEAELKLAIEQHADCCGIDSDDADAAAESFYSDLPNDFRGREWATMIPSDDSGRLLHDQSEQVTR